jgi:anti-sigma factor RsiW
MDEPLQLLPYLYGELSSEEEKAVEERLARDADLRQEYEELRAVKADLDERPASATASPDAATVDRIVEAAADASPAGSPADRIAEEAETRPDRPAADRPARTGAHGLPRRLQTVSAALALLLVVGVGWWQWSGTATQGPATAPSSATSSSAQVPAPGADRARTGGDGSSRTASLPEWDEGDEVIQLHRRIELIQSRSTPSQWSGSLQPASQTRRP